MIGGRQMKRLKKVVAAILAVVMIVTVYPQQTAVAATKTSMSKCKVSISKTSYYYTGSARKPSVIVTYKNKKLKK